MGGVIEVVGLSVNERVGIYVAAQFCGNMTQALDLMADTGAHILELDSKVDLRTARECVGQRVRLMGNLNPVECLWRGTTQQVREAARAAIDAAGQGGGFILGSGCEVPVAAPQENLHVMIDEARRLPGTSPLPRS